MQRSWLRFFAEQHSPMLYWLAGVAVAAIGVTLTLWSALPGGAFALLAIPLVLLAGAAAALAEVVQAFRHHRDSVGTIASHVVGTVAIGIAGLLLSAALAFATVWIADCTTIIRHFPVYQQVVADVRRGTIPPSSSWQERDNVRFMAETNPRERVVFQLSDGDRHRGIAYDPSGGVMMSDIAKPSADDSRHRIGSVTLLNCRSTPIAAYYRCDLWESGDDEG